MFGSKIFLLCGNTLSAVIYELFINEEEAIISVLGVNSLECIVYPFDLIGFVYFLHIVHYFWFKALRIAYMRNLSKCCNSSQVNYYLF